MIKHGYKYPEMTSNCVINQPSPSPQAAKNQQPKPKDLDLSPGTHREPRDSHPWIATRTHLWYCVTRATQHWKFLTWEKKTAQEIYVTLPPPRPFVPETLFLNMCASSSVIFRCYRV